MVKELGTPIATVAVIVLAMLTGSASAAPKKVAPLRVAVAPGYYPMIFNGPGGKLDGADVHYVKALSERLQRPIELVVVPFDQILEQVATWKVDLGMSGLDVIPPRANIVYVEYFSMPDALLVKAASPLKAAPKPDLSKTIVGAIAVSAARIAFSVEAEKGKVARARGYEGEPALLDAMERGQVDAVVLHLPAALERVRKSEGKLRLVAKDVTKQPLGIAIAKTSTGLAESVQAAVKSLRDDGTAAKIEAEAYELINQQVK